MRRATPKLRVYAERLIAYEMRGKISSKTSPPVALRVGEKLRPHLANFMGNAGFGALLSRALALAHPEVPWLRAVQVNPDGSSEGFDALAAQVDPGEIRKGSVVLLAQLLGLLVAFIGEALTLQLVHEVWPKLSFNGLDAGTNNEKTKKRG